MKAITTSAVVLACAVVACNEGGRVCSPGDYRHCECAGSSTPGYELCADDGTGYGACDCSGKIPAGSGVLVEAGAPDAAADSGLAGFLAPCMNDTDCTTHLCFAFNAFGPHCSMPCTKDSDCPAPSPGCSHMNVCKIH